MRSLRSPEYVRDMYRQELCQWPIGWFLQAWRLAVELAQTREERCDVAAVKMQTRRRRKTLATAFEAWGGAAQRSKKLSGLAEDRYERHRRRVTAAVASTWARVAQVAGLLSAGNLSRVEASRHLLGSTMANHMLL